MVVVEKNQPRVDTITNSNVSNFKDTICNSRNKEVNVRTLNIETFEEVPAQVSYNCGVSNCYIGESDGTITSYFPSCVNGEIIAENKDVGVGSQVLSTTRENEVTVYLEPYYYLDYEIQLINKNTGATRDVENEQVMFEIKSDNYNTIISNPTGKIKIIPGEYNINSYVMSEEGKTITIPERKFTKCVEIPDGIFGLLGKTKSECIENTIPEQSFKQNLIGGGDFGFSITRDELESSNRIIFYAVYDDSDTIYEDPATFADELSKYPENIFFEYPKLI
jgi:hypothetical protein